MTINWSNASHEAAIRDILDAEMNVMGVLKFDNGRHIDREQAETLWRLYWHKMDRIFFGRAADRGLGIERRCFTELGEDDKNLHMHFAAASPIAVRPFCAVANAVWVNLNKRTADYETNRIMPVLYPEDCAAYTTKSTRQQALNEAGLRNTWRNFQAQQQAKEDIHVEAQIKRIQQAVDDAELITAYNWIDGKREGNPVG